MLALDGRPGAGHEKDIPLGNGVGAADAAMAAELKQLVYTEKIVVVKEQDLSLDKFVTLGRLLGEPAEFYEPMAHYPENPLLFASSNAQGWATSLGAKDREVWQTDYQFTERPFSFTLIHPQIGPYGESGTYFIDPARSYRTLLEHSKAEGSGLKGTLRSGSSRSAE